MALKHKLEHASTQQKRHQSGVPPPVIHPILSHDPPTSPLHHNAAPPQFVIDPTLLHNTSIECQAGPSSSENGHTKDNCNGTVKFSRDMESDDHLLNNLALQWTNDNQSDIPHWPDFTLTHVPTLLPTLGKDVMAVEWFNPNILVWKTITWLTYVFCVKNSDLLLLLCSKATTGLHIQGHQTRTPEDQHIQSCIKLINKYLNIH
ncbi:hypothetical protein PAXRUDRAFT_28962 [Paxillus rubicundulus Ve08.2h10]|uniref:Unplaced genomic scaffold scaffold_2641, whole genome shotgun sequence n=1 Tax=Paxillus rubicundulus Ve08.2h10 TaxID=930991 RepID=A0A0D0CZ31_9AGAM|nr:hypothetical protein PAXRUDRAFT_28962 [Paxillus rubicundulus Ve08.2h10]